MQIGEQIVNVRMLLEHLICDLRHSDIPLVHNGCPFCEEQPATKSEDRG
jgi:hypothetical protein